LGSRNSGKQHREEGVEQHGQHDIQERHPLHRVARDRAIGPLGLDVGAGLGIDVDIARAAAAADIECMAWLIALIVSVCLKISVALAETPVRY
jgi:hypothetical protein